MKACSKCGTEKPLDEFYKNEGARDGRRGDCKVCVLSVRRQQYLEHGDVFRARVRRWQAANQDKVRASNRAYKPTPASTRRAYLKKTYGLTPDEVDAMFAAQDGRCAVCLLDEPGRFWTVDHDHVTGAVRGILCWHCNVALGHLRDDVSSLMRAADYLLRSQDARSEDGAA